MKRILYLLLICLWLSGVFQRVEALEMAYPKYEIRAIWLTTIGGIDWPHSFSPSIQKEELCRILDKLKSAGINTVFLQTRLRGTTIYHSSIEPWDGCITGKPGKAPNYDPLQFAIDECHRRGIQLHAWVVTIPIGKWNKLGCAQLRKKRPKMVTKIGDEGYMNPEKTETADYLAGICSEIVKRYDVDGVHLDYIRYPETWKLRVGYQQGRTNITNIVRNIYHSVKTIKPWVMVSCSPIGKHDDLLRYSSHGWNARTTVCQDAQMWLKEGVMDALFPMMYFRDNNFFPFAIDWKEHSYQRFVVPGLGIYFLDPKEGRWTIDVIERQLNVLRQIGLGHCYFRSKFFTDNVKGIFDLGSRFDGTPSLIPPMTWMNSNRPPRPQSLTLNGGLLKWTPTETGMRDTYLLYNIYASKEYPVDITKASNLVATRLMTNELYVQPGIFYAVTAQDRYGQESDALQIEAPEFHQSSAFTPLNIRITTGIIDLPSKGSTLDADYIVIETLLGQTVEISPYRGKTLNISSLPDGIYQLRSLGRKGKNHRLGYFSLKHER